jgi:glycosyltransferase involved in cell wall biosynthesis
VAGEPGIAPDQTLVSVILPVFNRAASVARAIDSVLAQTWSAFELLIVDDGSTDETLAVLERYRSRATIIRQENAGAYAARNLGLRHARGSMIAFQDSDDAWLPDKLERQVPLMRPHVGLVYGDVHVVSAPRDDCPRLGYTGFTRTRPHRGRVLEHFASANFVPTCTALVRKSALEEIGGFQEGSRLSADYLAWFQIAQRHMFDYVPAPVAVYTQHEGGISSDLGRSLEARIRLFQGERARAEDAESRRVLDRLLFNLGAQLALATVRGRAKSVSHPFRLAREAAAEMDSGGVSWSSAAFLAHQIRARFQRLLP